MKSILLFQPIISGHYIPYSDNRSLLLLKLVLIVNVFKTSTNYVQEDLIQCLQIALVIYPIMECNIYIMISPFTIPSSNYVGKKCL